MRGCLYEMSEAGQRGIGAQVGVPDEVVTRISGPASQVWRRWCPRWSGCREGSCWGNKHGGRSGGMVGLNQFLDFAEL